VATLARTSAQSERQRAAVEGSLGLAQDSADRGEYADALLWIHILVVGWGDSTRLRSETPSVEAPTRRDGPPLGACRLTPVTGNARGTRVSRSSSL
jgi:hypothetical protein